MAPVRADPTNALHVDMIVAHLREFAQQVGIDMSVSAEGVSKYLQDRNVVAFLDTGTGAYCAIRRGLSYVDDGLTRFKVEGLFPRGMGRAQLVPPLAAALGTMLVSFPNNRQAEIWADFMYGVDDRGEPDGGASECRAWAAVFVGADVAEVTTGYWIIRWRLNLAAQAV